MATITANNTALPEPSKLTPSLYMIGDSKRNAAGTMNIQYIANKRKYVVQWGTMSASQLQNMIGIIKSTTPQYTLSILDSSVVGGVYTGTFYTGDITWDSVKIDAYNNVTFKDLKTELIEC